MNILKEIYLCNTQSVKLYYKEELLKNVDIELAFSLYRVSKTSSSLEMLRVVTQYAFKQNKDEKFQDYFFHLVRWHVGSNPEYFDKMKSIDGFKVLLQDYHQDINDNCDQLLKQKKKTTLFYR